MSHIVFKKNRSLNRLVSGALVVAVAAGSALLLGGLANASTPAPGSLGTLSVTPATGTDLTAAAAQLSAACPTNSTSMNVSIIGPVAADGTVAQTATFATPYPIVPQATPSTAGPFSTPFAFDFKDAAADRGGASNLMQTGQYNFTATCSSGRTTPVATGTFTGAIYFTSPTAYTSTDPNPSPTTSTVLTTTPASPATQGAAVTLNAAITPTPSSATVAGTVQFKDGTTNINGPVTVTNGTASTTTSTLTASSHQLTAVFTSTAANVTGSTSAPVTFVVNSVGTPTTTTLTVTPSGSVTQGTAVTLNGSVSPTTAAGSIQFTDNGTNLGSAVPLTANGTASTSTSTLAAAGSPHSLVANFIPTNSTAFAASSSQPVSLTVTGSGGGTGSSATENISTTIAAAGSLVISVANTNVVLPTPVLNAAGTLFTTSGKINPVTVTDTRGADPGWSVNGQVTDFSDGASHAINGDNLGWAPNVVDKAPSQTVTAGGTIAPANGIAPGATPPSGSGLKTSRTLATAAAAAGLGTAHLDALLSLNAPTSTPAGTYNATLTLTAI